MKTQSLNMDMWNLETLQVKLKSSRPKWFLDIKKERMLMVILKDILDYMQHECRNKHELLLNNLAEIFLNLLSIADLEALNSEIVLRRDVECTIYSLLAQIGNSQGNLDIYTIENCLNVVLNLGQNILEAQNNPKCTIVSFCHYLLD